MENNKSSVDWARQSGRSDYVLDRWPCHMAIKNCCCQVEIWVPMHDALVTYPSFSSSSLRSPFCLQIFRTHLAFFLSEVGFYTVRSELQTHLHFQSCFVVTFQTTQFSLRLLIESPADRGLSVGFTVSSLEMEQGKSDVGENFPHAERHAYR